MKKTLIFLLSAFIFFSCRNAPDADEAEVNDPIAVNATEADSNLWMIDTVMSQLTWVGSKPTASHHGIFKLANGSLEVDSGQIKGGKFTVDINSMEITDLDPEDNAKFVQHLLSADFFDAQNHPDAYFEIVSVVPFSSDSFSSEKIFTKNPTHIITGNLKLRDSIKSVRFPARIFTTEKSLSAQANFNIDRSLWGLSYGNDKSLGNKFISPIVNIGLDIRTQN